MAPQSAAALLATEGPGVHKEVKAEVVGKLKDEWALLLEYERSATWSKKIHDACPHTLTQTYREILSALESAGWHWDGPVRNVLCAWFPKVNGSSNIEDVFAQLQDSVARSSKRDCGSLANLQAVAIRAVGGKVDGPQQARGIQLEACDYEGATVRGLKPTCFAPTACPSRYLHIILAAFSIQHCLDKSPRIYVLHYYCEMQKKFSNSSCDGFC